VLEAFDEGVTRLSRIVADAARHERGWRERISAALLAVLAFFDEQPDWARFLILESRVAPLALGERRQRALRELARGLERETLDRTLDGGPFAPVPRLTAELLIGGVFSVLQTQLSNHSEQSLVALATSLMAFVTRPYGGVDGAAGLGESGNLPVRVTYRTTRVLAAISAAPRSNNREVADAAGLRDEGQTSKLLSRLERRGLIENVGLGAAHGEPNAWLLSASGERVLEASGIGGAADAAAAGGRRIRGVA
jgi:hypothetical protein